MIRDHFFPKNSKLTELIVPLAGRMGLYFLPKNSRLTELIQ